MYCIVYGWQIQGKNNNKSVFMVLFDYNQLKIFNTSTQFVQISGIVYIHISGIQHEVIKG